VEVELADIGIVQNSAQVERQGLNAEGSVRLNDFGRGLDPGGDLLTLRALLRLVKTFQPQIIHTHTAKAGLLGVVLAARTGLPLVHSFHGHVLRDYWGERRSEGLRWVERALCRRRTAIHCVSESCADELVELGVFAREDCVVIPSILDPSSLEPAMNREHARERLTIDPGEWAMAWVGRLVAVKDPGLLAETLRHLVELAPDRPTRVHVFGAGPLESELRQAAQDLPLIFHGARADLPQLLRAFDLMLSTSRREGFPVSVLEALAQGVPVVGPEVPGLVDLAGPGLRLCARDAASLASACLAPQAVPVERSQTLRRLHDPMVLASRYAELYRKVLY